MKKAVSFAILAVFLLAAPAAMLAQEVDITGTWVGETYVPDALDPDKLTLVFAKKDEKWTGTFSDTMGYASEAECEEIKIDGHIVTLHFDISDDYETQIIYVTLEVDGDSMAGAWENEAGEGAEIKLEKKK
ncbi:MAG: hypothetical protein ACERK6_05130 [Candidatus Aminicenantaceae bacterium]|jgi:hypothetical protein